MNFADSTLVDDWSDCPLPFFDDTPLLSNVPTERYYKIYHDGGHFIATLTARSQMKRTPKNPVRKDIDILFDSLFRAAIRQGLNNFDKKSKKYRNIREMTDFIRNGIVKLFPDYPNIDGYIEQKIKRKYHNIGVRKKRFRRKAYLNRWNYFVTFTYDDKKHTPETFRAKLRKCLSNLHTRRGWRYMGVFEYAPETGRLHFHGLVYVPDGEMISHLTEKKDYSTSQGKIQITHSNDFFAENFGRNDFEEINEMAIEHGRTPGYILKYIEKQDERIVYSRSIPTEICKKMTDTDIITSFVDYVEKYILYDNVISWETDVMHFASKQMTFIDIMCNPPRVA